MCVHGTSTTLLLPTPDYDDPDGLRFKLRQWPVDSCIASIVAALNAAGVTTTGSCCGHGEGAGNILLADGRALIVTTRDAALETGLPPVRPVTWDELRESAGRPAHPGGDCSNCGVECASEPSGFELEDDAAVWEVLRDGTRTPTAIAGYVTGDQRGLVALHFAQDDEAGWLEGQYNELLWVRRCKPDPEREPGQAIRVVVSRDLEAEREWAKGGSK